MSVDVKELSEKELLARIEGVKKNVAAEQDALNRYEEELERRKQEVPLGVPDRKRYNKFYAISGLFQIDYLIDENDELDDLFFDCMNYFSSEESAKKHIEMMLKWRKALVANAKGEPIDISSLIPFIKKGYVAMDDNKVWYWFSEKPEIKHGQWMSDNWENLNAFNLKPAEDWRYSLMECGL